MKSLPILLPLCLLFLSPSATADGRYRLSINTGTSMGTQAALVEVRDERLRWSGEGQLAGQYGYLLIRDDRLYQVMTTPWPMAMDLGSAVQSFGGQGLAAVRFAPLFDSLVSLERSGRYETVGGIRGEVWDLRAMIGGELRRIEVVLDEGAAALDLREAIVRTLLLQSRVFQTRMPSGYLALYNALSERSRGLLRYGQAFRLLSHEAGAPAAERFVLP